jgi:hypothetical protein
MKDRKRCSNTLSITSLISHHAPVESMTMNSWIIPYECFANASSMVSKYTWTHIKIQYVAFPSLFTHCSTKFLVSGPDSQVGMVHPIGPCQRAE